MKAVHRFRCWSEGTQKQVMMCGKHLRRGETERFVRVWNGVTCKRCINMGGRRKFGASHLAVNQEPAGTVSSNLTPPTTLLSR